MAKKFFKQKVHNKKRTITQIIIISICVVGIVLCFFIAGYFNNLLPEGAVIELRDSVSIEVNSSLPSKTTYFSKLENITEDAITVTYPNIDMQQTGEYPINIKVHHKKYTTVLRIVDTVSPELTAKDVTINEGETYQASDFVESCTDNSNQKCQVEFFTLALTQDGEKIDFSKYTTEGKYLIQIVAKDSSNNQSNIANAYLTIGSPADTPFICSYGDNSYDTEKYIMAVDISENGCALSGDVYSTTVIPEVLVPILDSEYNKIFNEFKKLNINGVVNFTRTIDPIPNIENTGLVGYGIKISVFEENNLVLEYYLNSNGTREYLLNKYNIN